MQQVLLPISKLSHNQGQIEGLPKNPRLIKDDKFKKLVKSIQEDPEMLDLRELIVYDNNGKYVVICGNMRLSALKELGHKEAPCKILTTDTPIEKLKAYTIKDNVGFGEHDFDLLANEWDENQLVDWGLDVWQPEPEEEEKQPDGFWVLTAQSDDVKELEVIERELISKGIKVKLKEK